MKEEGRGELIHPRKGVGSQARHQTPLLLQEHKQFLLLYKPHSELPPRRTHLPSAKCL